jgi:tetratricopeptide (TPR) repeat protein
MTTRQERYDLGPLADFMAEDILSTPGRKLVEEVTEDCGDPEALASAFDKIVQAELPGRADKPACSSVGLGQHRTGQSSLSSEPLLSRWRRSLSALGDIVFVFPNRLVMALISAQLTKVAVALALLLGVGSVGFYFAKDFNSLPANVATSTSPDLTPRVPAPHEDEPKLASVPRPNRPPTDSRERTTEFLTAYDGGDCFFITPERLSEDPQARDVDGLGRAEAPFNILSYEFQRQFGFDAAIGLHRVTAEQCPAVNFLFRTRNQPGTAPRLDIVTTGLTQNTPVLSGFVAAAGDRHVELLLITEDGFVLSATHDLKPTSNGKTFSVKLGKTPGPPGPQLVFAIASSKPLAALNLPPDGSRAEQVFAQVLTEAAQRSLTINVSTKYFVLGKGAAAAEAKRNADDPPALPITPPPPVATALGPGALAEAQREQEERTVWDRIKDQDDVAALRDFVNKYPSSPYAITARNRLELRERVAASQQEEQKRQEALRQQQQEQKRQEEQARVAALQQQQQEERKRSDNALCDGFAADPDKAIPGCTRLLDAEHNAANLPPIYSNRGAAWMLKGLYSNAIDDFNAAIQRDPKFVKAYQNRGLAWHKSGEFDRALADFNQAITLDANSAQLYNARGLSLLNKGEYDRAIVDFNEAIRLDSRYASAFNNRGLAQWRKLDFDRAIADFTQVIRLVPNATMGFINRAGVLVEEKADFAGAIKDYDEAIKREPNDWSAYSKRGDAFRLKGDLNRALADHNDAIKRDPTAVDAYNNRALLWRDKGDLDRAIADYDQAILLNPRYDRAYANRSEIWRLKGNLVNSLSDLNKALTFNPSYPLWLVYRAETYRAIGDFDRALADFNEALRILPTAIIAYTGRAQVYESKGDEANARADYQKALSLPSDVDASLARPAQAVARQKLAAIEAAEKKRQEIAAAALARPPIDYGRRVALVISNAEYRIIGPSLPNVAADGEAIANALRDTGFQEVMYQRNLTRDAMVASLRRFQDEADHADWAMIYYAGHGIEVGGTNYMIPVDAALRSDRDVPDETISLDRVLTATEGARKLRLVIIDACRDNPFVPQMRRTFAARSIGRGLARIEPEGGTVVVYSAKEGQVAIDGSGRNSPFLLALLDQIKKPNIEINKLFRLVRDEVLTKTNHRQEPFVYGSLPAEDFYFVMR